MRNPDVKKPKKRKPSLPVIRRECPHSFVLVPSKTVAELGLHFDTRGVLWRCLRCKKYIFS